MERLREMGISDPNKIYDTNDLAPGKKDNFCGDRRVPMAPCFAASDFFGSGKRTHSVVMTTDSEERSASSIRSTSKAARTP